MESIVPNLVRATWFEHEFPSACAVVAGREEQASVMLNSALFSEGDPLMKALLGLVGIAVALCAPPLAGAADLSGIWKGDFDFNGTSVPAVITLKVTGTDVTGTVLVPTSPPSEIQEGKVDGDNVTFWMNSDYQGTTYKVVFKGKIVADHIDFSFGTDDGSWGTTMSVKKDEAVPIPAGAAPAAAPAVAPAPAPAAKVPDSAKAFDVTGAWKGAFDVNGTSMPIVLNLKSAAAMVTGTAEGMGAAPIEIHDGKIDGNVVTFWLNSEYQGQTYVLNYKGTVAADHIDFSFGTADGAWGTTVSVKK